MKFTQGQKIEVGIGEYNDSIGEVDAISSYFMTVDIKEIDKSELFLNFRRFGTVLYIRPLTDDSFLDIATKDFVSNYLI